MAEKVKKGDIIRLKKGMKVKVTLPEKFCDEDRPFSHTMVSKVITIGEILTTNPYTIKKVEEKLKDFCLVEFGIRLSNKQVGTFAVSLPIDYEEKRFDTSFFEGEYEVLEAQYLNIRIYPYYVKCRKKDCKAAFVEFYQQCPAVKCNNDDVEVIGHI